MGGIFSDKKERNGNRKREIDIFAGQVLYYGGRLDRIADEMETNSVLRGFGRGLFGLFYFFCGLVIWWQHASSKPDMNQADNLGFINIISISEIVAKHWLSYVGIFAGICLNVYVDYKNNRQLEEAGMLAKELVRKAQLSDEPAIKATAPIIELWAQNKITKHDLWKYKSEIIKVGVIVGTLCNGAKMLDGEIGISPEATRRIICGLCDICTGIHNYWYNGKSKPTEKIRDFVKYLKELKID